MFLSLKKKNFNERLPYVRNISTCMKLYIYIYTHVCDKTLFHIRNIKTRYKYIVCLYSLEHRNIYSLTIRSYDNVSIFKFFF